MSNFVTGAPGIRADRVSTPRKAMFGGKANLLPGGRIINGALSRDPINTGDVDVLRAGMLMGRITATGLFAPSVIGSNGVALTGAQTQLNLLNTAEATELVRRVGATGTFNITGPPSAAGVVRTLTATYSAVGGGTPVNEVQTATPDAASTAGHYHISLTKADGTRVTTAAIAFDATLAAAQAAVTLALGGVAGCVLSSAGSAAPFSAGPIALVMTFSGTGYLRIDQPMVTIDITALTGVTTMTIVETTKGVPAANTVTITALGVSEVQVITPGAVNAGAWRIRYLGDDGVMCETAAMAFNADAATIQTAVRLIHADMAAVVVTGSGSAGLDDGTVTLTWPQTGVTAGPHNLVQPVGDTLLETAAHVLLATTRTATGVNGDFVVGSLIQPVDGSQTVRCIINDGSGIKVTDEDGVSLAAVPFPDPVIGGVVDVNGIVNYPADASLRIWLKAAIRAFGIGYAFSDDFTP